MPKRPDFVVPPDLEARILDGLSADELPAPSPGLRARVLDRVAREVRNAEGIITTRAGEGWGWFALGVESKVLTDDGRTRTWLARMRPGATLPAHHHAADEECLVVEGSCLLGEVLMHAGDYQLARKGTSHEEIRSPAGCVLWLRTASPAA